jgi:hypothetical protein
MTVEYRGPLEAQDWDVVIKHNVMTLTCNGTKYMEMVLPDEKACELYVALALVVGTMTARQNERLGDADPAA